MLNTEQLTGLLAELKSAPMLRKAEVAEQVAAESLHLISRTSIELTALCQRCARLETALSERDWRIHQLGLRIEALEVANAAR